MGREEYGWSPLIDLDDFLTPWVWLLLPGVPLHEASHYLAGAALGGSAVVDWSEAEVWVVWDHHPGRTRLVVTAFAPWILGGVLVPVMPRLSRTIVALLGSGTATTGVLLLLVVNYVLLSMPSLADLESGLVPSPS